MCRKWRLSSSSQSTDTVWMFLCTVVLSLTLQFVYIYYLLHCLVLFGNIHFFYNKPPGSNQSAWKGQSTFFSEKLKYWVVDECVICIKYLLICSIHCWDVIMITLATWKPENTNFLKKRQNLLQKSVVILSRSCPKIIITHTAAWGVFLYYSAKLNFSHRCNNYSKIISLSFHSQFSGACLKK